MIKQGFTLIEILIALLAASIISIMSFDYLSNSVFLKERVEQNINLNNKHFNAINILRLDLMQSVPFQMKDTTGRDLNVSFIGGKDDQILKFITLIVLIHLILIQNLDGLHTYIKTIRLVAKQP